MSFSPLNILQTYSDHDLSYTFVPTLIANNITIFAIVIILIEHKKK